MTDSEKKIIELERSVLFDTPEELDKTCKRLGDMYGTSRALGLACHFRGLEWVKVLVDNGFVFKQENMLLFQSLYYMNRQSCHFYTSDNDFMFALLDPKIMLKEVLRHQKIDSELSPIDRLYAFDGEIDAIPEEKRLECVKYFIGLNNKEVCDLEELLYIAIIYCDFKVSELLKENGITLSQSTREMLITGDEKQFRFVQNSFRMTEEEYVWAVNELSKELDEGELITLLPFYIKYIQNGITKNRFIYEPKAFECFLTHFNTKKLNQKETMQGIISIDSPEHLEVCERQGWLRLPKKRDEMIKFASENGRTECTAWLLDFKKRTADPKAEREKAEKKVQRELNADPFSVTEIKKSWGFEKREDGGIVIKRYKGKGTEVNVPDRIGRDPVREIGKEAFSVDAPRLTKEQKELRKSITKIALPKTLEAIREGAFGGCRGLISVNIPEGTKEIGADAFFCCNSLSEIKIPLSVKEIGETAFYGCTSLTSLDISCKITKISENMFAGCTSLEKIIIPSNIKEIEGGAFRNCIFLEEAILSEGTGEIGDLAFYHCLRLMKINIPLSVKKIGENVFSGCEHLTVTVLANSNAEKYCRENNISYIILEEEND
ncbi:MAG: leucine-rich repeat protein [Ruminiclostridium sp.]|nr:leucine-rich repeat protein [Ruminiclostridium sp.]